MKRYELKNLVVSMAVGTAVLMNGMPANLKAITSPNQYEALRTLDSATIELPASPLEVKELTALDIWVERLAYKESNGREKIKVLDVNNKYSYGCLQFQEGTFRTYASRYKLIEPGTKIEDVIYSCELQKEITKRMIEESHGNWRHWYTSVVERRLGVPPRG